MIESEGAKDILTVILIIATSIKDLFALKGAYHTLVPFSSVECTNPSPHKKVSILFLIHIAVILNLDC